MAPGGVHAGYKNSLYLYTAEINSGLDCSFEEWLAELTTGLELAMERGMEDNTEDNISDFEEGAEEQTEAYSARKKEWEEILEQAEMVEAMLRQALENGLGQQKEEERKPAKKPEEELDNDFTLEGSLAAAEGKSRSSAEAFNGAGNSQFLETKAGTGAEYLNLNYGGRKEPEAFPFLTICLTCETECDRKKQWKISEE